MGSLVHWTVFRVTTDVGGSEWMQRDQTCIPWAEVTSIEVTLNRWEPTDDHFHPSRHSGEQRSESIPSLSVL